MTDKEAIKLAIATLDEVRNEAFRLVRNGQRLYAEEKVWNTIAALKERLADPMHEVQRLGQEIEQEPPKYSFKAHWEKDGRIGVVGAVVRPDGGVHLLQDFIDPPQRTEQEPVGTVKELFNSVAWEKLNVRGSAKVYLDKDTLRDAMEPLQNTTTSAQPPQRTWVGLTDEEFHEACWNSYVDPATGECSTGDREYAVRWTEAKLKEKNT